MKSSKSKRTGKRLRRTWCRITGAHGGTDDYNEMYAKRDNTQAHALTQNGNNMKRLFSR